MRILGNVFRATIIIAMGCLMGWYVFQEAGLISVLTALYFTAIGWLLSRAWKCPENKKCDEHLEPLFSSGMAIDASVAEPEDTTDSHPLSEGTIL